MQASENLTPTPDIYRTSRFLYILEAGFEYFVSILVSGAFLAKLTSQLGMSDSLTGILSAFVALGGCFQILSVFLVRRKPVKRKVTFLHTVNQLCFTLVYLVPFLKLSGGGKALLFTGLLLMGYLINNLVNPVKLNWYMSLVDDKKRGIFTAKKEVVSLIGGIIVSLGMGTLIDRMEANGLLHEAFLVSFFAVLALMLAHTATLVFSRERPEEDALTEKPIEIFRTLFRNRFLLKVIVMDALWNVAYYSSTPFFGTYQIKELGFSLTLVSALSIVACLMRVLASRFMGNFADRHSFLLLLRLCYLIQMTAFLVCAFVTPQNGKVLFTLYMVLLYIGEAGRGNADMNVIFDTVDHGHRAAALALKQFICGTVGFLTTLAISPLVKLIQENGNRLFGFPVYAQQFVSLLSAAVFAVALLYHHFAFQTKKTTP